MGLVLVAQSGFLHDRSSSRTVSASAALHLKPFVSVARVCHGSACFAGFLCKQALHNLDWQAAVSSFSPKLVSLASFVSVSASSAASHEAWPHFPAFSSRTARCCKQCSSGSLLTDGHKQAFAPVHSLQCQPARTRARSCHSCAPASLNTFCCLFLCSAVLWRRQKRHYEQQNSQKILHFYTFCMKFVLKLLDNLCFAIKSTPLR